MEGVMVGVSGRGVMEGVSGRGVVGRGDGGVSGEPIQRQVASTQHGVVTVESEHA